MSSASDSDKSEIVIELNPNRNSVQIDHGQGNHRLVWVGLQLSFISNHNPDLPRADEKMFMIIIFRSV